MHWAACVQRFSEAEATFAIRINPLRIDPAVADATLRDQGITAAPVAWLPYALTVSRADRERILESSLIAEGAVYVQNLSSMLAVHILGAQPGEQILDLAAAPGGKTTQLAALMNNTGWLSAVEPIRPRYYKLQAALRRYGVTIGHTYLTDGRTVGRKTPNRFDRVLLDAPCSGEARFRAEDPDSYRFWSRRKIREQSRKQRGLIKSAFQATRPGGLLLYSTCSYAPEENESIVDSLLSEFEQDVEVLTPELPISNWQPGLTAWQGDLFDPRVAGARRIIPEGAMDPFFLCLLRKLA